ncbi:MAG TPA: glycosyl transferase [Dokdonella sp.]|uniref:glycosyl transferase n=1 Tax=Dokdonella sp. TaxID=2291710 RepID=UPI002D7E5749|nr:glycosyl transferase [Dokdonella sp.]HET9032883.1 glycosyl transferase [Dokdonella sp.]
MSFHRYAGTGGNSSPLLSAAWIPLWLAAALFAIFQTGFMPLYSTRTLGVAWEMWNSGQFLVPHANGLPYSHKVPLLFWLIHAGWFVGGVGDVWPRLLEVLIGLGVLFQARRLARVLFRNSPEVSRLTPWLLAAFSYAFLFSLQIMYEMLLTFCVLAAINALVGRDVERRPMFVWFAIAVAAGLLSKGPVMLLHVVFPFLLGPLWHPWARRSRAVWYLGGGLALLAGCAALAAWAIPASVIGGEVYRNELFYMQTAGRVVDSFDHARPWWWYGSMLPALLLPWLLWPRAWQAAFATSSAGRQPGRRLIACWMIPVLVGFSLVSGKQTYYFLPELAGVAMFMAAGFVTLSQRRHKPSAASRPWLLAVGLLAIAGGLLMLPQWVADGRVDYPALVDISMTSPWFAVAAAALGMLMFLVPRNDVGALRMISAISIAAVCLAYLLFARSFWVQFDLRPAAERISSLQNAGIPVAHFQVYENQFQYLGRLQKPLDIVIGGTLDEWSATHPQGRVIHYVDSLTAADLRYAELVQPFRSTWLLIEPADTWIQRRRGLIPALPDQPAIRYPSDYWPYAQAEARPATP